MEKNVSSKKVRSRIKCHSTDSKNDKKKMRTTFSFS